MSIALMIDEVRPPVNGMRSVMTTLTCDGLSHKAERELKQQTWMEGGFMEQFSAAMRAGWKVGYQDGERRFYCPACSGKVPISTGGNADD